VCFGRRRFPVRQSAWDRHNGSDVCGRLSFYQELIEQVFKLIEPLPVMPIKVPAHVAPAIYDDEAVHVAALVYPNAKYLGTDTADVFQVTGEEIP
jgi:hypothetical protein